MDHDNIDERLGKPLIEKLQDMQKRLQKNIDVVYLQCFICDGISDKDEFARTNGQLWGLTFVKGMLDAILQEETRILWDKEKKLDISE